MVVERKKTRMMSKLFVHIRARALDIEFIRLNIAGPKGRLICR
jgi:hypothetical protein